MCAGELEAQDEPGFRLRRALPADLEAMYQLDLRCFDEAFQFNLADMIRFATIKGTIAVVGEYDGGMAGFLIMNLRRRGLATTAYVTTVDVAPEFRRQGLAGTLLAYAEDEAARAGVSYCGLHVWTGNAGAIAFYEGAGYRRARMAEDFYAAGTSAWVYRKRLR